MSGQYDRYQQGFYQEVYDEFLAMQEHVFESHAYEEALLVARAIMKRVRYNIELLIPRLHLMGYRFGEGFSEEPEEAAYWEQEAPIYKAPTSETPYLVASLEQSAGILPLTLKCWYEEVGSVNFVGTFPVSENRKERIADGSLLAACRRERAGCHVGHSGSGCVAHGADKSARTDRSRRQNRVGESDPMGWKKATVPALRCE